jgi:hypothetical protein
VGAYPWEGTRPTYACEDVLTSEYKASSWRDLLTLRPSQIITSETSKESARQWIMELNEGSAIQEGLRRKSNTGLMLTGKERVQYI